MSTHESSDRLHESDYPSIRLQDVVNWASGFVNTAINTNADHYLSTEGEELWNGLDWQHQGDSFEYRLVQLIACQALAVSPAALCHIATRLTRELVKADPHIRVALTNLGEAIRLADQEQVDPALLVIMYEHADQIIDRIIARQEQDKGPHDDMARLMEEAEDYVVGLMSTVDRDAFPKPAQLLWDMGSDLLEGDDSMHRAGVVFLFDAMLATPGAAEASIRSMRAQLVDADPNLALVARQVTP